MKKLISFMLLIALTGCALALKAETVYEDMSNFTIQILLEHCDQQDDIKVVRLKNKVTGRDGFCIEPYVSYHPTMYKYLKKTTDSEKLYELYHAYDLLEKSDEAFITIQLMMWEELTGERFTFEGKDASDFLEEEVLRLLSTEDEESETIYISDEALSNQKKTIEIEDLDDYLVESQLNIDEASQGKIIYSASSSGDYTIELTPKSSIPSGAYVYHSDGSQDIYAFEGEYIKQGKKIINVKVNDDDLSVSFSKLDLNNNPISGAQFTLYRIDELGEDKICFLKTGTETDLSEMLIDNIEDLNRNQLTLNVSERYRHYLNGLIMNTDEIGYFPYEFTYEGQLFQKGMVYVIDDLSEDYLKTDVDIIATIYTDNNETNSFSGLKTNNTYYLCESEPAKGYIYASRPCQLISTYDDSYLADHVFYNEERSYRLNLVKNNPDRSIALNGALFRLSYTENGITKEHLFRTGSLNIFREDDLRYVIYKHEDSDEVYIREFTADQYIEDNVSPGRYLYYLSDENGIDLNKLDHSVIVSEGSFIIDDLPYSANLKLTELEAPRGYYIDEADYVIRANIPYSEITFTNSRVNSFDIIPENRRKIPKTCIGE